MPNLYVCDECREGVPNDDIVWRSARWLCLGCAPNPVPAIGVKEVTFHLSPSLAIAIDDLRKEGESKKACMTRLILDARDKSKM